MSDAIWRDISWKTTMSVRRLMNSGLNVFFTVVSMASPRDTLPVKPMLAREAYCAPALEVMMMMALRKSARSPWLSVSAA